jgi:hypothetical protein
MLRFVEIVERWALSLWVGALAGFAFIFAPAAFARLSGDLDLFASIVVRALENLAVFGYACGGVAVVTSLIAIGARRSRRAIARAACVVLMVGLVAFSQNAIVPRMLDTQTSFHASFNTIPKDDPRRIRYDALHAESSRVYGAVLILGLCALAL